MSQNDGCYNYTEIDTSNYTVNSTRYSNIISESQMNPYYVRNRLNIISNITSTSYEKSIDSYSPDPDIERTDSNGDN